MPVAAPMLVRNTKRGPTVFAFDGPPKFDLRWEGVGDPSQRDWLEVPEILANDVNFRRVVQSGVLEVVEASEDAMAMLTFVHPMLRNRLAQSRVDEALADESILEQIDPAADNDLVPLPCVGPGSVDGKCGEAVLVVEKDKDDAPPLCEKHSGLASQYSLIETDVFGLDSKPVKEWRRAAMSRPKQSPKSAATE